MIDKEENDLEMYRLRMEYERRILSKIGDGFREYVHGKYSGPAYEPSSTTKLSEIEFELLLNS
jgi:hypothetical protein